MTGFFVRVATDGGGVATKDISELTASELDRFLADREAGELRGWVRELVRWIRENVQVR